MARKSKMIVGSKGFWTLLGGVLCLGFWGCEKGSDPDLVLQACFDLCAVQATAVNCPDLIADSWEGDCRIFCVEWVTDLPEGCQHWAKVHYLCKTKQEYHCDPDGPEPGVPVMMDEEACAPESADLQLCLPNEEEE